MLTKLKTLARDFKSEAKNLKKLIIEKKAGTEEILTLRIKYVVKLLQVIFKRK